MEGERFHMNAYVFKRASKKCLKGEFFPFRICIIKKAVDLMKHSDHAKGALAAVYPWLINRRRGEYILCIWHVYNFIQDIIL